MADRPTFEFKVSKLDLDALFALQTANLAVVHEAQNIALEAAQAVVAAQVGWTRSVLARTRALAAVRGGRKPEAVLAEVKAATQETAAVAKQGIDLGVAVQKRIASLLTQRAQANVDELRALAA